MYRKVMTAHIMVHAIAMNLFRLFPIYLLMHTLNAPNGWIGKIGFYGLIATIWWVMDKYLLCPLCEIWDKARIAAVKDHFIRSHPLGYLLAIREEFGTKE